MFFVNAQTLFSSHEDFLIIITENKYNQIKHEMWELHDGQEVFDWIPSIE